MKISQRKKHGRMREKDKEATCGGEGERVREGGRGRERGR